ncbi:hypothetical protein Glove_232g77 [Diversispora epigaea]|uniref:Uncharacterized protein n=1 Tax=Diversispora epigaea TaxID=1348612 RepID=A0A397IJJ6_9GLOM|nr:hypothetical protein Glove_232g77 [Diversispora epigaea]
MNSLQQHKNLQTIIKTTRKVMTRLIRRTILSRLFLISTLLLVGIITIAIGAPFAETIEVVKAVKFPQMGSSNFTLNRRFIAGILGLPQCLDEKYPDLFNSFCLYLKQIISTCNCPDDTVCMNFATDPGPPLPSQYVSFTICVDKEFVKKFKRDKDGVFCQTYVINGVTGEIATISVDVYDSNSDLVKIRTISVSTGTQYGSKQNTNNYTKIINCKNGQKIKVCMDIAVAGVTVFAIFTLLDGLYSSSN